jgi:hypothetical protein
MTLSSVIQKRTVFGKDAVLTNQLTAKTAIVTDNSSSPAVTVNQSGSGDAIRITQTGSGNALVVEDSTNPDSTPFVVKADGKVGVGTTAPTTAMEISGAVSTELRVTSSNNQNPTISLNRATAASWQIENDLGQLKIQSAGPGIDSAKIDRVFMAPGTVLGILDNVGVGTFAAASKLQVQGDITLTSSTTATAATAGTSGAIPAQVAGYLVISINGTSRKIPYYAT